MIAASSLTIISYTVPAASTCTVIMLIGKQRRVHWSLWEPMLLALPFLMVYLYVWGAHGSIREAVIAMGFHPVAVVMIAGLGGFLAGLSLLPRLFYKSDEVPEVMVSATSAFLVGIICLKMFALMAAIANPKAFIAPG